MRRDDDPPLRDFQEQDKVLGRHVGAFADERLVTVYVPSSTAFAFVVPVVCCLSPFALVTLPCGMAIGSMVAGGKGHLAVFPVLIGAIYGGCWPLIIGNVIRGLFADSERREALSRLREMAREPPPDDDEKAPLGAPIEVFY